jgi:hypothetical protein
VFFIFLTVECTDASINQWLCLKDEKIRSPFSVTLFCKSPAIAYIRNFPHDFSTFFFSRFPFPALFMPREMVGC